MQYVETPGYNALLLRRTFADLNLPDALIPMSHDWLSNTPAKWNEQKHQWKFPSGATLTFGYCENDRDVYRYQGPAFSFCGWDELTQFNERPYRYLFSRLRKRKTLPVPLRIRAGFNPGGIGHEWVRARFVDGQNDKRRFVPAKLEDNPYLDRESYIESLGHLDPVTRAQLQHGNWDIRPEGNMFKRAWFDIVDAAPPECRWARAWDMAATESDGKNDPDWAAGAKLGLHDGTIYIGNMIRLRGSPGEVEKTVGQTAELDGRECGIRLEQEPGSAGKVVVDHYLRKVLLGYSVRAFPASGDKVSRAKPFSSACERRGVKIVRGPWVSAFLDELCSFPQVGHDDQVDAAVNAFEELVGGFNIPFFASADECSAVST